MKIRHDFVTNSSSTSYCCVGVAAETFKECSEMSLDDCNHLNCISWDALEYGDGDVGVSIDNMKDDQTLKEFKQQVAKELNEAYGTSFTWKDMCVSYDGGYEG